MSDFESIEKILAQNVKTKASTDCIRETIGSADDKSSIKLLKMCDRSDVRCEGQNVELLFDLWSFLHDNNFFSRFKNLGLEC